MKVEFHPHASNTYPRTSSYRWAVVVLSILVLAMLAECVRSGFRIGDFRGYPLVGQQVLDNGPLYKHDANTWPPFFSIVCVPIAIANSISEYGIRLLWNLGSLLAFVWIVKVTATEVLGRIPVWKVKRPYEMHWQDWLLIVPILFSIRFVHENLANIQINIFILALAFWTFRLFTRDKNLWAGLILAFIISIKVYPIFILLYFGFKREWKVSLFTVLFMGLFLVSTVLVLGWEKAVAEHQTFLEIASHPPGANYKNQSVLGMLLRFLTAEPNNLDWQVNFASLNADLVKRVFFLLTALVALIPAWMLRNRLEDKNSLNAWVEYGLVMAVVPILSPLAWKAYFIFLWLPYLLLFIFLFRTDHALGRLEMRTLRILFWISILLTIFTSQVFVGRFLKDAFENVSLLVFGTLLMIGLLLWIIHRGHLFFVDSIRFAGEGQAGQADD